MLNSSSLPSMGILFRNFAVSALIKPILLRISASAASGSVFATYIRFMSSCSLFIKIPLLYSTNKIGQFRGRIPFYLQLYHYKGKIGQYRAVCTPFVYVCVSKRYKAPLARVYSPFFSSAFIVLKKLLVSGTLCPERSLSNCNLSRTSSVCA